ncbi:B12-binding domain-containing radical SAM protein [Lachnobacterium bovis]|uniref:Radical SAM superfamily enzyme YgiQ, UPF0313 family n=1 Tax=Lachnobacterium bovis TaxID=140626 RepID=A0A1H9UFQ5_9FIRM|nr:B12-binding domain-containing radical SAM protein [Lachnobacterium bovis]SES07994.1 Radical SAM superfamily enzyme YgiQ, UPF0313 family [Lachnobacterium bovis]
MKILLTALDAKFIHSNLAIYCLASYADEYRNSLKLKEYTINQQKDFILRDLYLEKPDIICFSCYIWNINYIRELISDLSKILPQTKIWLGGPEVSYNANEIVDSIPEISGVMIGEGEETFLEFCKYYVDQIGQLNDINGLAFRPSKALADHELQKYNTVSENILFDESIIVTRPRDIFDLDKLPFCYEVLNNLSLDHRIIYYESSRGCPFNCSYCLSSIDKKVRFRSLDKVFHELQFFIDHEVPQVKFVDRTFNCNHKRTIAIWKYMMEHDKGITNFHCEIAAEILNDEEIELLKQMRPGLVQLEIGVQTTNPMTLEAIHRPSSFEHLASIVNRIHTNHNVHMHLDLIAGLPHEDLDSFANSFNDVYSLLPEQLQMGFLKVLKGSFMHAHQDEYDCVYQQSSPFEVLSTKWISYDDILLLKQVEEMVEVYYNSGQFTKTLPYLVELFKTPFSFFKALGEFYAYKNYDKISHNRIRKYEILIEFSQFLLEQLDESNSVISYSNPDLTNFSIEKLKELCLLDLYLRENLKKRPNWMKDLTLLKEETKNIYMENGLRRSSKLHIEPFYHLTHSDFGFTNLFNEKQPIYCVFDYENRNPIDHNATITLL